jgi:hypothetical protein
MIVIIADRVDPRCRGEEIRCCMNIERYIDEVLSGCIVEKRYSIAHIIYIVKPECAERIDPDIYLNATILFLRGYSI